MSSCVPDGRKVTRLLGAIQFDEAQRLAPEWDAAHPPESPVISNSLSFVGGIAHEKVFLSYPPLIHCCRRRQEGLVPPERYRQGRRVQW